MRTNIRADISQHCAIKMAFEQILGNRAWLDLKESTSIATWKQYTIKLLRAIRLAVEETIQVRDDAWFMEICEHIEYGLQTARSTTVVEELLSGLSATLMRVIFLQIGMVPNRTQDRKVTLARDNWRLDGFRTVQYVQSKKQSERLFWNKQQKLLGFEKQMKLRDQYRRSKSKIPYPQWCGESTGRR